MSEFEHIEDYLPETVKGIVEVIGLQATEKLIKAFGGTTFHFSNNSLYFNRLKELLGLDIALKLQSYIGVGDVYIPRCDTALIMLRNQQIYIDFCRLTDEEKLTGRLAMLKLCPKYGMSDRIIWDIVRSFQRQHNIKQSALF